MENNKEFPFLPRGLEIPMHRKNPERLAGPESHREPRIRAGGDERQVFQRGRTTGSHREAGANEKNRRESIQGSIIMR